MANSSSKRQKAVESDGEGGIDRISDLPDSILLHILSFLPTKTCVCKMSLVSCRWCHLWKHLQVFDFFSEYCFDDYDMKEVKKFAFFVNTVLTLHKSRDILIMRLDCLLIKEGEFSMIDFIDLWVRAAIGPRLEELDLCFPTSDEIFRVVLPHTLLKCSNLVSLGLSGPINWKVQHSSAQIYFPSLRDLYLADDSVNLTEAFLAGCPILETLDIINEFIHFSSLRFRVPPSLKKLKYNGYVDGVSTYIDIDAPCLEYLCITEAGTLNTAVGNLQNVMKAYIDIEAYTDNSDNIANRLLNLLRAISGTKHLTLGFSATKLLLCAPIQDFPVFHCLLHLNLKFLHGFNLKLLAKVLENCHVLQDFVIESCQEALPPQIWEPESTGIPNCLVSHLTSIHIKKYHGLEDELTFVEYILRNALVLKTMIIESYISMGLEEKLGILKKIINIRRGSDLCQVEFD